MPDIEIWSDEGSDEADNGDGAGRRSDWPSWHRPATRRFTVAVAVVASVLAVAVCVAVVRQGDPQTVAIAPPSASPSVPAPSGGAGSESPASPVPVSTGLDVLDYTGVFVESGSLGSGEVTYVFGLVNETPQRLRIVYPIRIVGHDNIEIVPVFAGIYDHQIATAHLNDFTAPAQRLTSFGPVAAESLLVRLHIDCDDRALSGLSPTEQPRILIQLDGIDEPASFSFTDLANGFVDAFRQDCG